ncbi:hypothetical protein ACWT_5943 [Actinoplanes sp. SE50]|nr:hypothetical protein ACPL_6075 [Actinoplanes sp. SE50/110]ATO85358.1 hypothetical protein ACWT_5943 [Actinoplanes sp. SE50]SLM02770.1 hypothetical protein ACSP50_6055 [Actinoplanes sp. SE50/110]
MGSIAEYGRYVRFACPAYSGEWLFFAPIGTLTTAGGIVGIVKGGGGLADWIFLPLSLIVGLAMVGLCFRPAFERRRGGPTPRLYCFEDGVVVATRGELRAFRWTELTVHSVDWTSGSGENYSSGTRRTWTGPDGAEVVTFRGDEPERAGDRDMRKLHEAALRSR